MTIVKISRSRAILLVFLCFLFGAVFSGSLVSEYHLKQTKELNSELVEIQILLLEAQNDTRVVLIEKMKRESVRIKKKDM